MAVSRIHNPLTITTKHRRLSFTAVVALAAVAVAVATTRGAVSGPTNLVAQPLSETRIKLTWNSSSDSDVSYFAVRRSADPNRNMAQWTRLRKNFHKLTAIDTGLTRGTKYYYYVTAIDEDSKISPRSNVASATPIEIKDGRVNAPTNVRATPVDVSSIEITWDVSTDPDYAYSSVRCTDDPTTDRDTWIRLPGDYRAGSATSSGLRSGRSYSCYVTHVAAGNRQYISPKSSVATVQTATVSDPSPRTRSAPIYNANWTAASDTTYFSKFSNEGSTVHPWHGFTTAEARHPGQRSWRVVSPPTEPVGNGNPARLQGRLRSPVVSPDGTERWYGVSFRLGADWDLDEIGGNEAYFCTLTGFRYNDGHPNGPGRWIGCHVGTQGDPMLARGVIIDPDTVVSGSTQLLGNFLVERRWIDAIAHIKWSTGSDGFAEFWTKFADEPWDSAVFTGRYSGQTDYWDTGGAHYDWIGYYGGDNVTTTRTIDYGPWRVGTTRASVDPANPAP
jgi:hypothetical protein